MVMKIYFYFLGTLLSITSLYAKDDHFNNPYSKECSTVVSIDECKWYSNCRLRGGTISNCVDKDLDGKPDGYYLIRPDAEERAHQNALNSARKRLQEYEKNNTGRLCPEPIIINGKIINYVQVPCK